jgi:ArsR family transcriptional regulator
MAANESAARMSIWVNYLDLKYVLKAMADPARLNILHQLAGGRETNVTDLVEALELSQPLVSWHLRSLRRVGLVRTRRRGREVYCSLDTTRYTDCQQALHELVASPAELAQTPDRRMSPLSGPLAAPAIGPLTTSAEPDQPPTGRPRHRAHARAGPPSG